MFIVNRFRQTINILFVQTQISERHLRKMIHENELDTKKQIINLICLGRYIQKGNRFQAGFLTIQRLQFIVKINSNIYGCLSPYFISFSRKKPALQIVCFYQSKVDFQMENSMLGCMSRKLLYVKALQGLCWLWYVDKVEILVCAHQN